MSENGKGMSARESTWYVVSAEDGVVAGPLADKLAAERLAESLGPNHIVQSGATLDPDMVGPSEPL